MCRACQVLALQIDASKWNRMAHVYKNAPNRTGKFITRIVMQEWDAYSNIVFNLSAKPNHLIIL